MKKVLFLLTVLLCSASAWAANSDVTIGGVDCRVDDSAASITVRSTSNNKSLSGEVTLPGSYVYNGVTCLFKEIDNYAFQGNTKITRIILQRQPEKIGYYAFDGCTALARFGTSSAAAGNLVLTSSTTKSVGQYAFRGCAFTKVSVSPSNWDGRCYNLFVNCKSLAEVSCTGNVASYMFQSCAALTKVSLSGCEEIATYAFEGCTLLASINLNNVKAVRDYAFMKCASLGGVYLNNVETLSSGAFYGCKSLTLKDWLYKVRTIGDRAFYYCESISGNLTAPELTSIGTSAFYRCRNLDAIDDLGKITRIPDSCFYDCRNVASINIPTTITSIGRCGVTMFSPLLKEVVLEIAQSLAVVAEGLDFGRDLDKLTIRGSQSNSVIEHLSLPVNWTRQMSVKSLVIENIALDNGLPKAYHEEELEELTLRNAWCPGICSFKKLHMLYLDECVECPAISSGVELLIDLSAHKALPIAHGFDSSVYENSYSIVRLDLTQEVSMTMATTNIWKTFLAYSQLRSAKRQLEEAQAELSNPLRYDINKDGKYTVSDVAEMVDLVANYKEPEGPQVPTSDPVELGYVDMGNGVLWAPCNLGASAPYEFGDKYAWGETSPKTEFDEASYRFYGPENENSYPYTWYPTKYNDEDDLKELEPEDDPVYASLGYGFYVPSSDDWLYLKNNSSSEAVTENGVEGYRFTSRINGNTIFIPLVEVTAMEVDNYMSSKITSKWSVYTFSSLYHSPMAGRSSERYQGMYVRPVFKLDAE